MDYWNNGGVRTNPSDVMRLLFSQKGKFPFEALLTILWYIVPNNRTPGIDFTGAANSQYATVYFGLSAGLVGAVFFWRGHQLRSD
jgi:hypothetical protein